MRLQPYRGHLGRAAAAFPFLFASGAAFAVDLKVTAFDVGQGNCVVVECPGGPPILADCGSTDWGGVNKADTIAAIQKIFTDSDQAPYVVLSHSDADHIGLVGEVLTDEVLDDKTIPQMWFGGARSGYASKTAFRKWMQANFLSQETGLYERINGGFDKDTNHGEQNLLPVNKHGVLGAGDLIPFSCGAATATLLTVNVGDGINANSLVWMVQHRGHKVLFGGDAEKTTQDQIVANYPEATQAISMMIAPHHGASTFGSNDTAWIVQTTPRTTVFSTGPLGAHGHPVCSVVKQYAAASAAAAAEHEVTCSQDIVFNGEVRKEVYSTFDSGSISKTY